MNNLSYNTSNSGYPSFFEGSYRYQFNGMEVDNEPKGKGNSYTTEFRQYDPRLGRWLTIDPLEKDYPWNSPYAFSENVVINAVELEGLERRYVFNSIHTTKKFMSVYEGFQKGTKTFKEVTDFLESKRGYRMSEESVNTVRQRLEKGKENDQLGLDNSKGVPYVASSDDVSNDNYIIVSIIVQTKDGGYDRKSFEIVRDGYTPSAGSNAFPKGGSVGTMEGMHGARQFANGLETAGLILEAFPLTASLGVGLSTAGDIYNSVLDIKQYRWEKGLQNTAIRTITFGLGKKLDKDISKAGLDEGVEHVRKVGVGQALENAENKAIELNTKPEN